MISKDTQAKDLAEFENVIDSIGNRTYYNKVQVEASLIAI